MAFERFRRALGVETAGVTNPNAGAEFDLLAQELEQFTSRTQGQLDQVVAEEGFQAGQEQGEAGIVDNPRTIRDKAKTRGALLAHQAALQTDIRDSVSRFAIEHPNDPDKFAARVQGLEEGLLKESKPIFQPFIRERIADYGGRAAIRVLEQQQAELQAAAVDDLNRGIEGFLDDARTWAFEGDVLGVEARREELDALLTDSIEGELLDEKQAVEIREQFEQAVTVEEIVGEFDRLVRNQGIEAGEDAIGNWQATKPSSVGMSVDEHEAITRRLITLKNRQDALTADERRKADAELAAANKTRRSRIQDAIKVMQDGFPVDADQARQLADDVTALEDPNLAADLDVAIAIQSQVHRFRRMPSAARAEELDRLEVALRGEGANRDQVELLKALKRTHAEVDQALESDPLGYHEREGLIDLPPLEIDEQQGLAGALAERREAVEQASAIAGRPMPILKAAEADMLAEIYEQAGIEDRVLILADVTAGAGDQARATMAQLAKNGHDQMALLGEFVHQGDQALARGIIRGQQVIAADSKIRPNEPTLYEPLISNAIGSAYADAPDVRRTYLDAAFSRYADLKRAEGDLSSTFNSSLFRDALEEVMPTARFNGWRVAIPHGASERAFDDWIDSWTAETFAGSAIDPTGEEVFDVVQRKGRLTELGAGRYGVMLESANTDTEKIVTLEDGRPLVLTFPGAGGE